MTALLSKADLITSLDEALIVISSGGHYHHAGEPNNRTVKSLDTAAADHGPPLTSEFDHQMSFHITAGANMKAASDEWHRPHWSTISSSNSSGGSQSDGTAVSPPDNDDNRSDAGSTGSTVFLSPASSLNGDVAQATSSHGSSTATSTIKTHPQHLDPLTRTYPAPAATDKLDLDEMLARKPPKWTLGHYFDKSRAAASSSNGGGASWNSCSPTYPNDAAAAHRRKSELEKAKKELLAAQQEIRRLSVGNL